MAVDAVLALERVLAEGDEWQSWRALHLSGEDMGDPPLVTGQDPEGAFLGPSGRPSPGATGKGLCHLTVIGQTAARPALAAANWLERARTPARTWVDGPGDVPGELGTPGIAEVWATAAAATGLLAAGRDPGGRAFDLLRAEADLQGRFTGGVYPTCAAAGAYRLAEGPKSEMAEWALRWARETEDEDWDPAARVAALTFWGAARLPPEHPTVELILDDLQEAGAADGWPDTELSLQALELFGFFGS